MAISITSGTRFVFHLRDLHLTLTLHFFTLFPQVCSTCVSVDITLTVDHVLDEYHFLVDLVKAGDIYNGYFVYDTNYNRADVIWDGSKDYTLPPGIDHGSIKVQNPDSLLIMQTKDDGSRSVISID